jgi:threonylcarbamoyladenosine tRNA methylthiotransferase MtaB
MNICFCTFGCKLNQAETQILEEKFSQQGWIKTRNIFQAKVCLINSCVVTQKAEKEVRQKIHQIKKNNPLCFLVVAGCFTKEMKQKEGEKVNLWVKNKEKENLDQKLSLIFKPGIKKPDLKPKYFPTRALIKIQSGCLNYCSYCLVPWMRNELISRPQKDILEEILEKERQGFREVVLVGTNIGLYSCPESNVDLTGLLKNILEKTTNLRIRLSSLWPTQVKKDLISLIKKDLRLCHHLHLSIQSASSEVLKKMNRSYTARDLRKIIKKLKKIKELNLTADFIVGFPGETSKDFKKTKNLVKKGQFLKIHVFRFSNRPQTKAALMKEIISSKEKQKRSQELIRLAERVSRKRRKNFLDKEDYVLLEQKIGEYWQGFTPNYLKVFIPEKKLSRFNNQDDLRNKIKKVKLGEIFQDGIKGELVV